ncbi:MAG: hypothetical protein APF80_01690 [Alphaproteobacteria bacterium BRH_c36]|nr:MAG: hypothetical protein APF80_01690 [Alphaproteobacteria bacterium BRH_c36]
MLVGQVIICPEAGWKKSDARLAFALGLPDDDSRQIRAINEGQINAVIHGWHQSAAKLNGGAAVRNVA